MKAEQTQHDALAPCLWSRSISWCLADYYQLATEVSTAILNIFEKFGLVACCGNAAVYGVVGNVVMHFAVNFCIFSAVNFLKF